MENIKIKKKYLVLIVLTLIVSTSTLTLSYFKGDVLNDTINKTQVTTGSIDIKIDDTSVIVNSVKPIYTNGNNYEKASFIKHFSVTNGVDSLNVCTKLYLRINDIDTELANSYFRYAVVNDDTGTTLTGNFENVVNGTELDLGSLYFFENDVTKNYTMYIWIEYDVDADQMSMLNKNMNATLYVVAQDLRTKDTCDTRESFTVTYVLNGGLGCSDTSVSKEDSVSLCTPTNVNANLSFSGWYSDQKYSNKIGEITSLTDDVKLYAKWSCTFDGELLQGAEYVNEQYTYRYKQEMVDSGWSNLTIDGWGAVLTDKTSTSEVISNVCMFINNEPLVSTSNMFKDSLAKTIDLSNFDTSKIVNMNNMFSGVQATVGYAKNESIASKFNDSSVTGIPETLTFKVK